MSTPVSNPAVKMPLTLKTVDNILRSIGQKIFGIQETRLLSGLIQRKDGGQTPHVLEKAFEWFARLRETGSMLP